MRLEHIKIVKRDGIALHDTPFLGLWHTLEIAFNHRLPLRSVQVTPGRGDLHPGEGAPVFSCTR